MNKCLLIALLILLAWPCCLHSQTSLMTFNIRYNNPQDGEDKWSERKEELCHLISYYHPHFVGIQESMPQQVAFINSKLPNYAYVGFGRDGKGSESESVPIFYDSTQYQLLDWEVFWLSESPDEISRGWDAALNRITTMGIFSEKNSGDTLYLFNAHFDHRGELAREKSGQVIWDKIESLGILDEKIIVMGDLNSHPDDEAIEFLKIRLDDAYELTDIPPYGPIGTFNGFDYKIIPERRIDYIFAKNLKVLRYRTINDKRSNGRCISDHLPVMVEIE